MIAVSVRNGIRIGTVLSETIKKRIGRIFDTFIIRNMVLRLTPKLHVCVRAYVW